MARAEQGAIVQNHRRGRLGDIEFGNCDCDIRALNQEFHVSQSQRLTGGQPGFFNSLATDESSIGGIAIAEDHTLAGELDLTVRGGDGGMVNLEIVLPASPQAVDTEVEFNDPVFETL
jgi:hypothetical protein